MPRLQKIFYNGAVKFVTTSVEEGFMLPPNPLIKEIVEKSLAQAKELYDVNMADYIVMSTHIHLIIGIIDPSDMADFMERFKTETAHAINRLLGRKKRTLWCEGYDSVDIPDLETLINTIVYIYENATKDNLVDCIEDYPGLNTFSLRVKLANKKTLSAKKINHTYYIPRGAFTKLENREAMTQDDYRTYRSELIKKRKRNSYEVDLNFFLKRFGVTTPEEIHQVSVSIVERVRAKEAEHRARRAKEGKGVLGRARLEATVIGAEYVPERTGRKMLVKCDDPVLRKETIRWMLDIIKKGKEVLAEWRLGNMTLAYPEGLFPPTGIRLVEPIGW